MVLILKNGDGKKEIAALEKLLYKEKSAVGFNAKKYNGVLKSKKDLLATQKKLRDEWERN